MTSLNIPRNRGLKAPETTLRKVLSQAISDSGLTYAEIARRSGLHRSTISGILSSGRPGTLETWDKMLAAAGVQVGYRLVP